MRNNVSPLLMATLMVLSSLAGCLGGIDTEEVVEEPIDSDGDGLSDENETNIHGTDPFDEDSDNDGINDGDEIEAGSDPNSVPDPDANENNTENNTGNNTENNTGNNTMPENITGEALVYSNMNSFANYADMGGMVDFYIDLYNLTSNSSYLVMWTRQGDIGDSQIGSINLTNSDGQYSDMVSFQIESEFSPNGLVAAEHCFHVALVNIATGDTSYSNMACITVYERADLIAGTDWTEYTAYVGDYYTVNGSMNINSMEAGENYVVNWFLNKSTDGDQIPDTTLEQGVMNFTSAVQFNGSVQSEMYFDIAGPNAVGLTPGWHCIHYDVSMIVGSGMLYMDSDDSCFDIEMPHDEDNDGWNETVDCDDYNASINPNATDIWNGVDDDCDNVIDPMMNSNANATFNIEWNTVGWVIDNYTADYEGHDLYWLGGGYFAYRFLASPDVVFVNGDRLAINNMADMPNLAATLATLGLDASNITISMSMMDLGTDTENVEWAYDSNTYIEYRYYSGGEFTLFLDDEPFASVEMGIHEYLDYSSFYNASMASNVSINGTSELGQINLLTDNNSSGALNRIADSFSHDLNGTTQFSFESQDAIIQEDHGIFGNSSTSGDLTQFIQNFLSCNGYGCREFIGATFNEQFVVATRD
ncbi:MAG: hypothetical protein CXT71_03995 [Methanobacteriota archaeon]|nr:MAG: hypothetical protein CXT71_03995 [Euryarchaeota archaeon]